MRTEPNTSIQEIHFLKTLEIKASGIFDNSRIAKKFNAATGQNLHLTKYRTLLNKDVFINAFFSEEGEGTYLEKCCGPGNVEVEISSPFLALHCLSGWRHNLSELERIFEERELNGYWNQSIFHASSLLSIDEIEKIILNPFRVVMVKDFGVVTLSNIYLLRQHLFK